MTLAYCFRKVSDLKKLKDNFSKNMSDSLIEKFSHALFAGLGGGGGCPSGRKNF
jgi:hypothetical protein